MKNTELNVPILIVTPPDINIKSKEKSETLSENSIRIKNKPTQQLGAHPGRLGWSWNFEGCRSGTAHNTEYPKCYVTLNRINPTLAPSILVCFLRIPTVPTTPYK